ncbi:hypothetical protein MKX01_024618 [Papaver californicum]|nr:hypothetical protein MKX01_024618 [Papaver californicum]
MHNHEEHLLLFSVFDFTCTAVNSLQGLEQITLSTAKKKSMVGLPPRPGRRPRLGNTHLQMSRADLRKAWDAIAVFDKRELDEWLLKILTIALAVGFDYDGICKVLEQLSVIRENRIPRIVQAGVLKGLSLSPMQSSGKNMRLYYGCVNFFEKIFRNKVPNASVHVISCWCEDLMRSALLGESDKLNLNEFDYETVEDLLCLLKADIGIVFGSVQHERDVGGWFGAQFVPLFKGTVTKQRAFFESGYSSECELKGPSGTLSTVSTGGGLHGSLVVPTSNMIPPCKNTKEEELCETQWKTVRAYALLQGDDLIFSSYPRNHYYKCTDTGVELQLNEEESPQVLFHRNTDFLEVKLNCSQCERQGFGKNLLGQSLSP